MKQQKKLSECTAMRKAAKSYTLEMFAVDFENPGPALLPKTRKIRQSAADSSALIRAPEFDAAGSKLHLAGANSRPPAWVGRTARGQLEALLS